MIGSSNLSTNSLLISGKERCCNQENDTIAKILFSGFILPNTSPCTKCSFFDLTNSNAKSQSNVTCDRGLVKIWWGTYPRWIKPSKVVKDGKCEAYELFHYPPLNISAEKAQAIFEKWKKLHTEETIHIAAYNNHGTVVVTQRYLGDLYWATPDEEFLSKRSTTIYSIAHCFDRKLVVGDRRRVAIKWTDTSCLINNEPAELIPMEKNDVHT